MSIRASRARARWQRSTCRFGPARTSPSSAGSSTTSSSTGASSATTSLTTRMRPSSSTRSSRTPRTSKASSPAGMQSGGSTTSRAGSTRAWPCTRPPASASSGRRRGTWPGEPALRPRPWQKSVAVPRSSSLPWRRRCARTRAASAPPPLSTRSAGPSTPSGCSTSARRRSSNCCSGTSAGRILALRGHASIQGSTDIPTLYDLLPGSLPMPHAHEREDLGRYLELNAAPTGFWGNMEAYTVSLLKAYWGGRARKETDFCFDYLPRITGDHSAYQAALAMLDGQMKGYFLFGENPAVGSSNSRLHRLALAELDWLVVRDLVEIESAAFWYDSPEVESGELRPAEIKTEIFLLPAASPVEKDGSFTNTQRLLQWHHKAVEPKSDCRSDLWFTYHLGRKIREKLASSDDPKDRPILDLEWHYPTAGEQAEPSAEAVLREINGWDAEGKALASFLELKADGSTTCGCWIYSGCFKDEVNQPARKKPGREQTWVAPEWGWAWPANRRLLYNRASADPDGEPWSERKKYVWWDEEKQAWAGYDVPDFALDKRPDYVPPERAEAQAAFENPLYAQGANPARQQFPRRENPYNPSDGEPGADAYPYVMTTYRLTEHHTAGGMTRTVPYLSELQPAMFCEVSPDLAAERGLQHGGWAMIITSRTAIE